MKALKIGLNILNLIAGTASLVTLSTTITRTQISGGVARWIEGYREVVWYSLCWTSFVGATFTELDREYIGAHLMISLPAVILSPSTPKWGRVFMIVENGIDVNIDEVLRRAQLALSLLLFVAFAPALMMALTAETGLHMRADVMLFILVQTFVFLAVTRPLDMQARYVGSVLAMVAFAALIVLIDIGIRAFA